MKPLRLGAGSRIDSHGVEKDSLPKVIFEDQNDTTQPSQSIELVDGALHVFNDPEGPNRTDLGILPGSGGGGGQVDEVIPGDHVSVDNTDPTKPVVSVPISGGPPSAGSHVVSDGSGGLEWGTGGGGGGTPVAAGDSVVITGTSVNTISMATAVRSSRRAVDPLAASVVSLLRIEDDDPMLYYATGAMPILDDGGITWSCAQPKDGPIFIPEVGKMGLPISVNDMVSATLPSAIGNNDFCLELIMSSTVPWLSSVGTPATWGRIVQIGSTGSTNGLTLVRNSTGSTLLSQVGTTSETVWSDGYSFSGRRGVLLRDRMTLLSISREGDTYRGFFNGTQVSERTTSLFHNISATVISIGSNPSGGEQFPMLLFGFRLTVGDARHTADYAWDGRGFERIS